VVRIAVIEKSLTAAGPRDCSEIYNSGRQSSGAYTLYVGGLQQPVQVYCDMTADGGWTVCISPKIYFNCKLLLPVLANYTVLCYLNLAAYAYEPGA